MSLDSKWIRSHFPSVQNSETIFFDNPGGTQVTQSVIDAFREYFLTANANHGGVFPTSERNDELLHQARVAFADFFNAPTADQIVFGPNMTTLTFAISRALGRRLHPDDEIQSQGEKAQRIPVSPSWAAGSRLKRYDARTLLP